MRQAAQPPPACWPSDIAATTQRCVNAKILPLFPVNANHHPPILPSPQKKERRPPVSGKAQLFRWLVCLRNAERGKKKRKKKAKKKAASQRKGAAFSVAGVPSGRGTRKEEKQKESRKEGRHSAERRSLFGGWCAFGTRKQLLRRGKVLGQGQASRVLVIPDFVPFLSPVFRYYIVFVVVYSVIRIWIL